MKTIGRPQHLLLVAILVAAALWQLAPAAVGRPTGPIVPSDLEVPHGNRMFLVGSAVGVQRYRCEVTADGAAWVFLAPRADVHDARGKLIMTHFGGPTWQARDGSSVVGRRVAGVTVDETAIPWLLLSSTSAAVGHDGDRLAGTTFIQRIATVGGLPPPRTACTTAAVGKEAEVPYTADYYFWR